MNSYRRATCRLCAAGNLQQVLSLTPTPLANEFVCKEDLAKLQPVFPLNVALCRACGHVQLLDVVSAELIFRDYLYTSTDEAHFRECAAAMMRDLDVHLERYSPLVVDLGSNNGFFLRCFKRMGCRVKGVEPAERIAIEASMNGVPTVPEFFTPVVAQTIRREAGPAALVTATNVMAHIDDLDEVAEGVKDLLADDGVFVFEVSYLRDVIEKTLMDTIYHEHYSYHAVAPLVRFFNKHGMTLYKAERIPPHGGSVRCFVVPRIRAPEDSVPALVAQEFLAGLGDPEPYARMGERIGDLRRRFWELLDKAEGPMAGFGAPAKLTTLMYQFGFTKDDVGFIGDDNPRKQGRFTPGLHIPVVPTEELYRRRPTTVVVLAWNFATQIIEKAMAHLQTDTMFIVPLPEPRAVRVGVMKA